MKTYIAIFWRSNPQLKYGGYETTREIEAKTLASATKKAQQYENGCAYGSMTLQQVLTMTEYEENTKEEQR